MIKFVKISMAQTAITRVIIVRAVSFAVAGADIHGTLGIPHALLFQPKLVIKLVAMLTRIKRGMGRMAAMVNLTAFVMMAIHGTVASV
jgi:hypothetical protein